MLFDYSLNCCQPDSCPFEFLSGMEPLERPKQFVRVLFVETGAVIADVDDLGSVVPGLADLDDRRFYVPGVLDCIRQQVGETSFIKPGSQSSFDRSPTSHRICLPSHSIWRSRITPRVSAVTSTGLRRTL